MTLGLDYPSPFQPPWITGEDPDISPPPRPPLEFDWDDDWEKKLRDKYRLLMGEQVWGGVQPQPRYRPAFYEMWGGVGGSQPYRDYFESLFPSLVQRFQAQLPTYKGYRSADYAQSEAQKIEKSWAEWLKGERAGLREQWWSKSPYQRGERPSYYAPSIKTVKF